jgi:8-oxo-dGTP pyrophosphatase MutT (NUDIX family)
MSAASHLTPHEISHRLASPHPIQPPWPVFNPAGLRKAAVLIPFQWIEDDWYLLFTRRTDTVQDHKGQVSFPGGAQDADDKDINETALREAYEEIGLKPSDVNILGLMGSIATMTNYLITPVVAIIPHPYHFIPSPHEVQRIFSIPFSWLNDPAHHFEKERTFPDGTISPVIYFDEYDRELLWGISAFITIHLLDLLR